MTERGSKKEKVFQLARALASAPDDNLINETVKVRNQFHLTVIQKLKHKEISVEMSRSFKKDIEDMTTIIEIARNMQKLEKKDPESILKKIKTRVVFGSFGDV